ncbi:MAG TPA: triose-phosphate isomerase family protein [Acidimicrobiales bacterium]|nr:triose-phosphate isomerase family protein [Acidimicrobiales bacterium]
MGLPGARHRPALKYFLANWKMYPTVDEARERLQAMQAGLAERAESGAALPRVIVCPPFVALAPLVAVADDRFVRLGAQNCHWEAEGPYTGEVSARMLRSLVEYVMVGHSERRGAGETDEDVARKVAAVVENGLTPILFVGEDEQDDDAVGVTERRLRRGLGGIDVGAQAVLVVYEPAWAIGAEHAAPADHVDGVVEHVKGVLTELGARQPEVLYGGTVAEENVDEFAALDGLDGMGATRASLDPESFLRIVDRMTRGMAA